MYFRVISRYLKRARRKLHWVEFGRLKMAEEHCQTRSVEVIVTTPECGTKT